MKAPREVEKAKKQTKIIVTIFGIIAYLLFIYFVLHFMKAKEEHPKKDFSYNINKAFTTALSSPFKAFPPAKGSLGFISLATAGIAIVVVLSSAQKALKKHDNSDTVFGEARFMNQADLKQYNMKRTAPFGKPNSDSFENMILSEEIKLAMDNRKTRKNMNTLVIGGSGAGKSRFFVSPNLLQYNSNFVITDPSGELLRDYGKALEDNGYKVKVFNITDAYKSSKYNPFHYIYEEKDVFILVNTLMVNLSEKGASGDQFWNDAAKLLLNSIVLYLWHVFPPEQQTFSNVIRLVAMADIDENDATAKSQLDLLFDDLEKEDPENLAVNQYKLFKQAAGKTAKSILITVGTKLQSFQLRDMAYLTSKDEMEFETFADTKQALFVLIPTADKTFNFITSLMYAQLFMTLYTYCETRAEFGWQACTNNTIIKIEQAYNKEESLVAKERIEHFIKCVSEQTTIEYDEDKVLYNVYTYIDGEKVLVGWRGTEAKAKAFEEQLKQLKIKPCDARCANHIRFILDEFANIGQIPDFNEKLATVRKYEISCSIILQTLSQIKAIYKDDWNTIIGNCDSKVLLGSSDPETLKWMSEMLGKKTVKVESVSFQGNGNGSTSINLQAKELITPDQIALMNEAQCIVSIIRELPYYGHKYELTKHPNYKEAIATKGKFKIPESAEVINRIHGPLRLRQQMEAEKKALSEEITDTPAPNSSFDNRREMMDSKNYSRKKAAKQAEKDLKILKERMSSEPVDNTEALFAIFGQTEESINNMSDEKLKEVIESHIILEKFTSDEINYYESQ